MATNDLGYYVVNYRSEHELGTGPFTHIDDDLVNADDGVAFDLFIPDPSLKKAKGFVVHKRKKLPDHLFAQWFLISEHAWEVFRQVRCCESIRWVPTAIYRKDGPWIADYMLAYGAKEHDIWDYARSDFYWTPGKTPGTKEAAGYKRRGIIRKEVLPVHYDFFRATHQEWLASRRLRDLVLRQQLTGFDFGDPEKYPSIFRQPC